VIIDAVENITIPLSRNCGLYSLSTFLKLMLSGDSCSSALLLPNAKSSERKKVVNISHPDIATLLLTPPAIILSMNPPAMQNDSIIAIFFSPSVYEVVRAR